MNAIATAGNPTVIASGGHRQALTPRDVPPRRWCTDAVGAISSGGVVDALAPKRRAALAQSDVKSSIAPLH